MEFTVNIFSRHSWPFRTNLNEMMTQLQMTIINYNYIIYLYPMMG